MIFAFLLLTYFPLFDRLQFHPRHCNWFTFIHVYGWVIFRCMYIPPEEKKRLPESKKFFPGSHVSRCNGCAASLDRSPKDQGLLNTAFDGGCIHPITFLPAPLVVKFRKNPALDPHNLLGASVVIPFHWSWQRFFFEEEKNVVHPYHFTTEEARYPERLELHRKSWAW